VLVLSGGNLGGGAAALPPPPPPQLHRKLTNFRKFWPKRGLKTVFSSANGGVCRKFESFVGNLGGFAPPPCLTHLIATVCGHNVCLFSPWNWYLLKVGQNRTDICLKFKVKVGKETFDSWFWSIFMKLLREKWKLIRDSWITNRYFEPCCGEKLASLAYFGQKIFK
jgi:hypothetical protein